MKINFSSFLLGAFAPGISSNVMFAQASIQAPLSKEQIEFVNQRAPILIQPEFENQTDNLSPFDYDVFMNKAEAGSQPSISTKDNFNDAARKAITFEIDRASGTAKTNAPAVVDWDFIEVGGAVSLNFLFHRPLSWGFMSDRRVDSEGAILAFKKKEVGTGLDFVQMIGWTNAHGVPLYGACSAESAKCLGPIFSVSPSLEKFINTQGKSNGRVVARIGGRDGQVDGRALIVSEHHTHALAFVTDIETLKKDIDLKKAVIYYPAGATELPELQNRFSGAIFVPYALRSEEFSSIIRRNIKEVAANKTQPILITDSGETDPKKPSAVNSFWGHEIQQMGIPSEFVDAEGKASGANPPSSWGVTAVFTNQLSSVG